MTSITAAHSHIGASSSERWMNCPGSVNLSKDIPKTTSAYAEAGTNAHTLGSELILGQKPSIEIPEDEMEAVYTYVNHIKTVASGKQLFVEQKFDLKDVYPGLFGTADAVIYDDINLQLNVIDYKHGAGVPVDVFDNSQLKYYALGALLELNKPASTIEITIVQPRCYHPDGPIRSFVLSADDLLAFAAELKEAAEATSKPDAKFKSGDHCKFCPAAGICPEIEREKDLAIREHFSNIKTYDVEKLAKALETIPIIEAWIDGVRAFAYAEACQGVNIPGHKLVYKVARRKWIDAESAKKTLQEFGVNDILNQSLKTPAQVEKILGKGGKDLISSLVTQESSGTVLVPVEDKRQAVTHDALPAQFLDVETDK